MKNDVSRFAGTAAVAHSSRQYLRLCFISLLLFGLVDISTSNTDTCTDISNWGVQQFSDGASIDCDYFSKNQTDWFERCKASCSFDADPSTGHTACSACCNCGGGQLPDRKELTTTMAGSIRSIRFGYGFMFTVEAKNQSILVENIASSYHNQLTSASADVWARPGKIDPFGEESVDQWTLLCDSCRFNILGVGWRGFPDYEDFSPIVVPAGTFMSFYVWTGNWNSIQVNETEATNVIRENEDLAIRAACITTVEANTPPSPYPYFNMVKTCTDFNYWMGSVIYTLSEPSEQPSTIPSQAPSLPPSAAPSMATTSPTGSPSAIPSQQPSAVPTTTKSSQPSTKPSTMPSVSPSSQPSINPSPIPSQLPTLAPTTNSPSQAPSQAPSTSPSVPPSASVTPTSGHPSTNPSQEPSVAPTTSESLEPSSSPTVGSSNPTTSQEGSNPPSMSPSSLPTTSSTSTANLGTAAPTSAAPGIRPSRVAAAALTALAVAVGCGFALL